MKRSEKQSLNCIRTTLNISTVGKESKCLNCGLLKESDYFYVDMWKRESVDGKGPKPVKDAITFLHTGPAVRKPKQGIIVTTILHKGDPLAIGDGAVREAIGTQNLKVFENKPSGLKEILSKYRFMKTINWTV